MKSVYTVITRNYLHRARVLMADLALHAPEAERWVFVVDDIAGRFDPSTENFNVVSIEQFAPPRHRHLAVALPVADFCFALKPVAAQWLRRKVPQHALLYFDADIRVLAPPDAAFALLETCSPVLTPHTLYPTPEFPRAYEPSIGTFNAGFLGFAPRSETDEFLHWWAGRMANPKHLLPGYIYDQMWLNLVPGFFPRYGVLRDPGYNVAYWNLHERSLSVVGGNSGGWGVNGRPLAFFHFSGFAPDQPSTLGAPALAYNERIDPRWNQLGHDYVAALLNQGAAICDTWGHGYATFADGHPITARHRAYFLNTLWGRLAEDIDPFQAAKNIPRPGLASLRHADHPATICYRHLRAWLRTAGI